MKTTGLVSKLFVVLAFALTLISLVIAGFFVPSIESDRQRNTDFTSNLNDVYSLEAQRFGQHALNLSAAAQIISSERILRVTGARRNAFTRDALLEQGREAVVRGMQERRKAIRACMAAVKDMRLAPAITEDELPSVPLDSAEQLFERFDESKSEVVRAMRKHVQKIQEADKKYETEWGRISKQIRDNLNRLGQENSVLNYKISFYMKLALGLQVLAMLSVFIKDLVGS